MTSSSVSTFLEQFGPNSGYVRELYELYLADPGLVSESWARVFALVANGAALPAAGATTADQGRASYGGNGNGAAAASMRSSLVPLPGENAGATNVERAAIESDLQERVTRCVENYRQFGHLRANINPLTRGVLPPPNVDSLDPNYYHFTADELERSVYCDGFGGRERMALRELIAQLQATYCGSVGYEFTHLVNEDEREWLRSRIEPSAERGEQPLPIELRLRYLERLIAAETFEAELHKKYVGHKRFSLEGGETLVPMLDAVLNEVSHHGVSEAIIGMPHRGRLNVLVNVVGKPMEDIFTEFEDQSIHSVLGSGDVKYHLGFSSHFNTLDGKRIPVSLACNPSHLEFVDPVAVGVARAKQDIEHGGDRAAVMPILLHGDAAFAGQGIVAETLQLSRVYGYRAGGTLHLVVNNQIGFTTNPDDARSSIYCTDMAKAVEAPVFHVNAEDVEAACRVVRMAAEFRAKYQRDVVVDLYCYRKYGHNEGDDPSFTQPLSYSEIRGKKSIAALYGERLVGEGVIDAGRLKSMFDAGRDAFERAQARKGPKVHGEVCSVLGRLRVPQVDTKVAGATLRKIAKSLVTYPPGFTVHPKLGQILEKRVQTLEDGKGIDWGFAEALAFGSLVLEGRRVRLSGQDCGRGTFSHRHLALNNYEAPEIYRPLTALSENGGVFEVYNSILSEAAVLGFEFGYASIARSALVLWEAQFGDFVNGAQVIIDQFIASSEAKWAQLSGIVLLLPHGLEGQGPEHSSARLERFLQICGDGNMMVCYPTNAAQYFHLMRLQGLMNLKRPLVVMTPKSLLRLPEASSTVKDLTHGQFQAAIEETFVEARAIEHVVMLSGKIYYDVAAALRKLKSPPRVLLLRIEQLYPFPQFEIKKSLRDLKPRSIIWVQEEPQNMGAWSYIEPYIRGKLEAEPHYVGRPVGASPATGSNKRHTQEQQAIVDELLQLVTKP